MFITNSNQRETIWCASREHGEQAIVVAAQRFSKKSSATALGAKVWVFYLLCLAILNSTEEWRIYHVQHLHTIIAILQIPINSKSQESRTKDCEELFSKSVILSRGLLQEKLHL